LTVIFEGTKNFLGPDAENSEAVDEKIAIYAAEFCPLGILCYLLLCGIKRSLQKSDGGADGKCNYWRGRI
jgi:hypothetical protein